MITAVASNVLLDVLTADPAFGLASREALRSCRTDGSLVACEVVWAEVSAAFPETARFVVAMDRLGIRFVPLHGDAATQSGPGGASTASRAAAVIGWSPTSSSGRTPFTKPTGC